MIPSPSRHRIKNRPFPLSAQLAPALVLLLFAACLPQASAQLQVQLKMNKKTFMAHEPVSGVLTLTNRAGREVVLDGPPGEGWLDFHVTDPRNTLVSPNPGAETAGPIVLRSGVPMEMRIVVNAVYPMGETGIYRIKASVYFPPLKTHFTTPVEAVNIVEGQTMWSQAVGVPAGFPGAGSYRKYHLMTFFQGAQKRSLYFRLEDLDTGVIKKTYALGEFMSARPPQYHVDNQSQLHVLHMAAPQFYFYTIIDPSGNVVSQDAYRDKDSSRPMLVTNSDGDVKIQGGVSDDQMQAPYEQREFRKLSERPPGIPSL